MNKCKLDRSITYEIQRLRVLASLLSLYSTVIEDEVLDREGVSDELMEIMRKNHLFEANDNIYRKNEHQ